MAKDRPRFRNIDLTDRELLLVIRRASDATGYATSTEIAIELGITTNGRKGITPGRTIASRLGWMRSGGLLERVEPVRMAGYEPGDNDSRWCLTEAGEVVAQGKLNKSVTGALARMDPGQRLLVMRSLMTDGWVEGQPAEAFALRREYEHRRAQRKLVFR